MGDHRFFVGNGDIHPQEGGVLQEGSQVFPLHLIEAVIRDAQDRMDLGGKAVSQMLPQKAEPFHHTISE